jgi:iron complex transport system permease protein
MALSPARRLEGAAREWAALAALLALLPAALVAGLAIGGVRIPLASMLSLIGEPDRLGHVLLSIRLPRVLMAGLVGASLALAGASLQALFRNPLADPGLIGVAAGAMLGVVVTIVFWHHGGGLVGALGPYAMPIAAGLGGAAALAAVHAIARGREGDVDIARLLLAGIGVNAFAASVTGLAIYAADDAELRSIQFWMLGSLSGVGWAALAGAAPMTLLAAMLLVGRGRALDAFTLGEGEAFVAGVDTSGLKRAVVAASALATGAAVAFTGLIGFVGLVAPHLVRLLGGQRHPYVLPASAALGAVLVILADATARTVVAPAELPTGIVTSLVGAPLFIGLLMHQRRAAA